MKKNVYLLLLVTAISLMLDHLCAQTTYPVVWENLYKADFAPPNLERQSGASGTASATSVNVSFGLTATQRVSNNGYLSYTPNDSTQVKKLGFSVMLSAFSASSNMVDYGFSFYSPGQVRAFTADTVVTMSYLNNQEFKVKRDYDSIFFYKAGTEVLRVHVDTTENLMLKAELTSAGADFNNVRVSFTTKRLLAVNPFLDHINNTAEMNIGGGYAPFDYSWEDAESFVYPDTAPNTKALCEGVHDLAITDSLNVTYNYKYLVGEDVTWGSFSTSQQDSTTLSRTSSSGWGSALSTTSIGQNDQFWIQKVADLQQVTRGVGVTYLTSGFTQFSQLEAGFMLLKDNQIQVIFQGSVVFTTKYYEHDVILLKRKGKLLSWYINGNLIYEFTDVISGSMKLGALLKDTAYMSEIVAYKRTIDPVVQSWDTTRLVASVKVNIEELISDPGPFHYYLSTAPVSPLHTIYGLVRDSIFGGTLDSLTFFEGDSLQLIEDSINGYTENRLSLLEQHEFQEVPLGVNYYVMVYDYTGLMILSEQIEVTQPLFRFNNTNVAQEGSLFTTTSSSNKTDLSHFIDSETGSDNIDFRVISLRNVADTTYFGYEDYDSTKNVIKYGFQIIESQKKVWFIDNGTRISCKVFEVRPTYVLSLEKFGTTLRYKINGVNRQNQTISGGSSYLLKARLLLKMPIEVKAVKNKPFKFEKTVTHESCSDDSHFVKFRLTVPSGTPFPGSYDYAVTDMLTGLDILSGVAVSGTYDTLEIPNGSYYIHGEIDTLLPFCELFTVGIKAEFDYVNNYTSSPNSYSLLKNASSSAVLASALSVNKVRSNNTGWVTFTPVNSGKNNRSYFSFSSDTSSSVPGDTYVLIYSSPLGSHFVFNYYADDTLRFSQSFETGISVTAEIKTSTIRFFINSTALSPELPFSRAEVLNFKAVNSKLNNGFKDILLSFCMPNVIYPQVEKVLTGVRYQAFNNTFYFSFYEEYLDSDSNLDYAVFNTVNNEKVLDNSSQPLSAGYGDNRKELDITSLANGTYILEVRNEKNESFYLRFTK